MHASACRSRRRAEARRRRPVALTRGLRASLVLGRAAAAGRGVAEERARTRTRLLRHLRQSEVRRVYAHALQPLTLRAHPPLWGGTSP